jgi:hypothetical protein
MLFGFIALAAGPHPRRELSLMHSPRIYSSSARHGRRRSVFRSYLPYLPYLPHLPDLPDLPNLPDLPDLCDYRRSNSLSGTSQWASRISKRRCSSFRNFARSG